MKAYYLTTVDEEEATIVFAENIKEAKKQIYSTDIYFDSWIDIRVRRDSRYDGMEKLSEAELALHQWRDGWRWFDYENPDPDTATDQEFLDWYRETFEVKR